MMNNYANIFDVTANSYVPTTEECNTTIVKLTDLLDKYLPDRLHEGVGMKKMFNQNGMFWSNKGWLIEAFKKHPNYNGNYQIVLKHEDMSRKINYPFIRDFFRWANKELKDMGYVHIYKGCEITEEEYKELLKKLEKSEESILRMYSLKDRGSKMSIALRNLYYKRHEERYDLMDSERPKMDVWMKILSNIHEYIKNNKPDNDDDDYEDKVQFCSADLAEEINRLIDESVDKKDANLKKHNFCASGQKLSKIVNKIGKVTGLDKIVNKTIKEIRTDHGYITREKDMGWAHYFHALFAEGINPQKKTGTVVISVNPYDFWTMSFGYKWASCHTIDKDNLRKCDHGYEGMYCGGCSSYMLDKHSIVFYYLPDDWDGTHPEYEDKLKRCMFFIGEDKVIQSRVYPDARDDGEVTISRVVRKIMRRVVSEIWNIPDEWEYHKGTYACHRVIYTNGLQYKDYECYEDCNVSYLKVAGKDINKNEITVGVMPICPECGEEHDYSDNVFCEECADGCIRCSHCGDRIYRDEALWVNGEPYCNDCVSICEDCEEPALNMDIIRVRRRGWDRYVCECCRDNYYTWCEYDDEWVYDDDVVESEEGNYYEEGSDGYFECEECGEIHDADEAHISDDGDMYCENCFEAKFNC